MREMVPNMRGRLNSMTRWLRLLLACLAVGSMVSPAQVVAAAPPVSAAQGGPVKKPVEVATQVKGHVRREAPEVCRFRARRFTSFRRPADPHPTRPQRFLLHRALLN